MGVKHIVSYPWTATSDPCTRPNVKIWLSPLGIASSGDRTQRTHKEEQVAVMWQNRARIPATHHVLAGAAVSIMLAPALAAPVPLIMLVPGLLAPVRPIMFLLVPLIMLVPVPGIVLALWPLVVEGSGDGLPRGLTATAVAAPRATTPAANAPTSKGRLIAVPCCPHARIEPIFLPYRAIIVLLLL